MSVGGKSHRMFQPDGPALLVQQFPRWDSQGQQPQQQQELVVTLMTRAQFNPPTLPSTWAALGV